MRLLSYHCKLQQTSIVQRQFNYVLISPVPRLVPRALRVYQHKCSTRTSHVPRQVSRAHRGYQDKCHPHFAGTKTRVTRTSRVPRHVSRAHRGYQDKCHAHIAGTKTRVMRTSRVPRHVSCAHTRESPSIGKQIAILKPLYLCCYLLL